jgi:zeta-carotene isomerase
VVTAGDRRLRDKFGERAEILISRTSVIPFAAILSGKQELPAGYISEFFRVPYLTILIGTIVAYYAHPFMQGGAALLHW